MVVRTQGSLTSPDLQPSPWLCMLRHCVHVHSWTCFDCQLSGDCVPTKVLQCFLQREQDLRLHTGKGQIAELGGCRAGRFPAWAELQAVCNLQEHLATAGQ